MLAEAAILFSQLVTGSCFKTTPLYFLRHFLRRHRQAVDECAQENFQKSDLAIQRNLRNNRRINFQDRGVAVRDDRRGTLGFREVTHFTEAVSREQRPEVLAGFTNRYLAGYDDVKRVVELAFDNNFFGIGVVLPVAGAHDLPDFRVREALTKKSSCLTAA